MHSETIVLDGTVNTRDLGGRPPASGMNIKKNKLIRSSYLFKLTEADCKRLQAAGLKRVVDFRTYAECEDSPDVVVEGVSYTNIPVLTEAAMGITKEKIDRIDNLLRLEKEFAETDGSPHTHMRDMYKRIITSDHAHEAYRRFFDILLEDNGGALLWHCTAGKDRAGLGAVLVEYALGVSPSDIMEDYIATNHFTAKESAEYADMLFSKTGNRVIADASVLFSSVDESYLETVLDYFDSEFGGVYGFIEKALGVGRRERERLAGLYLE